MWFSMMMSAALSRGLWLSMESGRRGWMSDAERAGATAVSYWTWSLFAASHLSTGPYALVAVRDWQMVTVFAVNTVCCISIILLTFYKRREHRSCRRPHGDTVDPELVQPEVLNRFSLPFAWRTS